MLLGTLLPAKRRGFNPHTQDIEIAFPRERYNFSRALADEGTCDSPEAALEAEVSATAQAE